MGVFYRQQVFLLFLGAQGTQTVRLRSKIGEANTSSCYYLTESCELHVIAKTRPRKKEVVKDAESKEEGAKETKKTGAALANNQAASATSSLETSFRLVLENKNF